MSLRYNSQVQELGQHAEGTLISALGGVGSAGMSTVAAAWTAWGWMARSLSLSLTLSLPLALFPQSLSTGLAQASSQHGGLR